MKGIGIKVIRGLINKGLSDEYIAIYEELDKRLNNAERQQIVNLIKLSSVENLAQFVLKKAIDKKILMLDEEPKKQTKKTESKENINKRQKEFLERKKQEGAKKLQVYIPEDTQIKFKKLQNKFGLTQAELIIKLIDEKYAQI
jgi:uncharacterized membrane protein